MVAEPCFVGYTGSADGQFLAQPTGMAELAVGGGAGGSGFFFNSFN
jgi:hypothetical protein